MNLPGRPGHRAQRESDTCVSHVFEGILSDGERDKLRDLREVAEIRIQTRIRSLREAKDLLERTQSNLEAARAAKIVAIKVYEEALIKLAEDEQDDFDTAAEKAAKWAEIETDYLNADTVIARAQKLHDQAHVRVTWELREAKRLGYMGDK